MSTFFKVAAPVLLFISILPIFFIQFNAETAQTTQTPVPPAIEQPVPIPEEVEVLVSKIFQRADSDTGLRRWEARDAQYRRYLAVSVQVAGGGSGTIIHYDPDTQDAYILSCGHMWGDPRIGGRRSAQSLQQYPKYSYVTAWYHDMAKLRAPKHYRARVLFWDVGWGNDVSLLKAKIDWIPEVFVIAKQHTWGGTYHSVGSDRKSETAHYGVEYLGFDKSNLVTRYNSPRPGRSGGGLLVRNKVVGICIRTSDKRGGSWGVGIFTPLRAIQRVFRRNGYDWLLNLEPNTARTMPIKSWKGETYYPLGYVPMPSRNKIPL